MKHSPFGRARVAKIEKLIDEKTKPRVVRRLIRQRLQDGPLNSNLTIAQWVTFDIRRRAR